MSDNISWQDIWVLVLCHKKGFLIRCDLSPGPQLTSYSSFTMMLNIMTSTIMTSLHCILAGTLLLYITVYTISLTTDYTLTNMEGTGSKTEDYYYYYYYYYCYTTVRCGSGIIQLFPCDVEYNCIIFFENWICNLNFIEMKRFNST